MLISELYWCFMQCAAKTIDLEWGNYNIFKNWEAEVHSLSNKRLKDAFCVTRDTFKFIVDRLDYLRKEDTIFRTAIVLKKRIGIALHALVSSAEYRTIASLFGVGRTTVGELEEEFINVYPPSPIRKLMNWLQDSRKWIVFLRYLERISG